MLLDYISTLSPCGPCPLTDVPGESWTHGTWGLISQGWLFDLRPTDMRKHVYGAIKTMKRRKVLYTIPSPDGVRGFDIILSQVGYDLLRQFADNYTDATSRRIVSY